MTALTIDRGTTWHRFFRFLDAPGGAVQSVTTAQFVFTIPKHPDVVTNMTDAGGGRWELILTAKTTRRLSRDGSSTYRFIVNGVEISNGPINPVGGDNHDD